MLRIYLLVWDVVPPKAGVKVASGLPALPLSEALPEEEAGGLRADPKPFFRAQGRAFRAFSRHTTGSKRVGEEPDLPRESEGTVG